MHGRSAIAALAETHPDAAAEYTRVILLLRERTKEVLRLRREISDALNHPAMVAHLNKEEGVLPSSVTFGT